MLAPWIDSCQYTGMVTRAGRATTEPDTAPEVCRPSQGRTLLADDAQDVAGLLKALADPVRLRLFVRLASTPGEVCVCDFPDVCVSQPTVSHHLRKLREAGLVDCERRGTWVYYRVVEGTLERLGTFITDLCAPRQTVR